MWDVIVVGLGAMGSSALYELSRRGLRVLGLEAFEPGHRLGSSHGESRIIRLAYHEHPNYVPLLRRAYSRWSNLQSESGEDLLTITGGLMIGRPSSEVVSGARASAEQHHLDHEVLSADEVRYRYPALTLAEDDVALWEPASGFLRPERCIETYVRLAKGADTRYSEPVRTWSATSSGVEVQTDKDTYAASHLVITGGARISSILGPRIPPVTAERAVLFWLQPAQPEPFELGRLPIYIWDAGAEGAFYGFPHVDWPGVKVARHHSGQRCDPDTVDRTVSPDDERDLRGLIAGRMPLLANGRVADSLVCLYENSADHHFLIDRLPDQPNVIYAGGFSGHGFKFASVVGEILADLVTQGRATPDAEFLRAQRLANV
jgi:sarcosine oxidase